MTNKLEQDKAIIANAPEGATHFDAGHCYWDLRRSNDYHKVYSEDGIQDFGWFQTDGNPDVIGLRSLADIKRIVELESLIKECDKHFDINKYTAIGNMSILHREMKQILNKSGDL